MFSNISQRLDDTTLEQIDLCTSAYAERLGALLPRTRPDRATLHSLKGQAWEVALLDFPYLQRCMDSFYKAASVNGGLVPTEAWTRDAQIGRYITQKAGGKISHLYVNTYENGEDEETTTPATKQPSRIKRLLTWVENGNDLIPDAATLAYWAGGSEASWRSTLSTLKQHGYQHERRTMLMSSEYFNVDSPVISCYAITQRPVSERQLELEARLAQLEEELVAVRAEYLQEIDPALVANDT